MANVASFDSAMLELYRAVGTTKQPVSFPFHTLKEARYFVTRMNKLRAAMRKERHWLTPTAEMVSISLNTETFVVTVKTSDAVFSDIIRDALKRINYEADPLPSAPGRSLQDQVTEVQVPPTGGLAGGEAEIPREKTKEEISKSEDALAKFLGKGGKRK